MALKGAKYLALVEAIERDVVSGRLSFGDRLPPHRELSALFGVTIATITKAIAEAGRRGLVTTQTGRGTFVSARPGLGVEPSLVELGMNVLPPGLVSDVIADAVVMATRESVDDMFGYGSYTDDKSSFAACRDWLAKRGVIRQGADSVQLPTHGVQQGLLAAISSCSQAGQTILVEEYAYTGALRAARLLGLQPVGLAMDAEGVRPDALDRALTEYDARIVVITPSVQNPTGRSMGTARREEIARVLGRHEALLVEDAVNMPLVEDSPPPVADFAPDRTILLTGFSKCVASGVRLGVASIPPALYGRFHDALITLGWMAPRFFIGLTARLVESGGLDICVARNRAEAAARQATARRILDGRFHDHDAVAYHLWIVLPEGWTADMLVREALLQGVHLTSSAHFCPENVPVPAAIRICLGAEADATSVEQGLRKLERILHDQPPFGAPVF